MRIASILNEKEITLSCEVFPPKHFDGIAQASAVAQEIAGLHPSFMSVTYGAAGSTPGHTIAVAKAVAETGGNAAVPPDVRAVDKGACAACAGGHEDRWDGERAGTARRPAQGGRAVP